MSYYIASVSWGKDSTAMLLRLIHDGQPLNEVVFYDTGMEFQAIYSTRDKIQPLLTKKGITYTELHPERPFLYDMLERPMKGYYKGKPVGVFELDKRFSEEAIKNENHNPIR